MPNAEFFARLGLVVIREFLDSDLCTMLVTEARSSARIPSLTYADGGTSADKSFRRASDVKVSRRSRLMVQQRLLAVKPKMEEHFGMSLSDCEMPDFLSYNEGDFFRMHCDSGDSEDESCPERLKKRKVSAVIFLNRQSERPEYGCYSGGSLSLHGLLDKPEWRSFAFPLIGEPGLLIAFRSDTYHEVEPVTHGERHSIVSWFV